MDLYQDDPSRESEIQLSEIYYELLAKYGV